MSQVNQRKEMLDDTNLDRVLLMVAELDLERFVDPVF